MNQFRLCCAFHHATVLILIVLMKTFLILCELLFSHSFLKYSLTFFPKFPKGDLLNATYIRHKQTWQIKLKIKYF